MVERDVANVEVVGPSPITRSYENYWLNRMNSIEEACDKLLDHLTKWYNDNKHNTLNSGGLYDAKEEFAKANPEYEKYEFHINFGFKVKPETYQPRCMDGCCIERITTTGVYVTPVDWSYTKNLAFKESKILKLRAELRR